MLPCLVRWMVTFPDHRQAVLAFGFSLPYLLWGKLLHVSRTNVVRWYGHTPGLPRPWWLFLLFKELGVMSPNLPMRYFCLQNLTNSWGIRHDHLPLSTSAMILNMKHRNTNNKFWVSLKMTSVLKVLKWRDNVSGIKNYSLLEFSWYITTVKFCS